MVANPVLYMGKFWTIAQEHRKQFHRLRPTVISLSQHSYAFNPEWNTYSGLFI